MIALKKMNENSLSLPVDDPGMMIRQYFTLLRKEKGHNPDASPMDLELLLIVKFFNISSTTPIQLLKNHGIIISGNKIAINGNLLHVILDSSRSRINNTLKRIGWNALQVSNKDKQILLSIVLNKADVRNWTFREIPEGPFLNFVRNNPNVQIDREFPQDPVIPEIPIDSNDSLVTSSLEGVSPLQNLEASTSNSHVLF